jgi:sugar transferase EpsL
MSEQPRMDQQRRRSALRTKRLVDLVLVVPALLIALPVGLLLALCVRIFCGSPVLFRQRRPGLDGRLFTLLKFRTMRDTLEHDGQQLPDAARLTKFGRLLRATSLDELPELWNVLRGEMSLVGPRPLLDEYLPLYSPEQLRRHLLRPGLTGWAQINGRNALEWDKRLLLDVWYVDNWSLRLDCCILARTLVAVLKMRDVTQPGRATVDKFRGFS